MLNFPHLPRTIPLNTTRGETHGTTFAFAAGSFGGLAIFERFSQTPKLLVAKAITKVALVRTRERGRCKAAEATEQRWQMCAIYLPDVLNTSRRSAQHFCQKYTPLLRDVWYASGRDAQYFWQVYEVASRGHLQVKFRQGKLTKQAVTPA